MKKQLIWIDIVKGITITLVVFLHVNYSGYGETYYYQIKNFIGDSWDMPVFFLIGGFFITPEKLTNTRQFLIRKFRTIYKKLIYYYLAFLCLHNTLISAGLLSTTAEYGGKHIALFSFTDLIRNIISSLFFMGREPYLAPLWFIYVMFMAFIIIAILAFSVDRFTKGDMKRWHLIMAAILAALCIVSLFLTNTLGITIPRCNNVFSAAWLIYAGYYVRNVLRINFTRLYVALPALLILIGICTFSQHMALITNSYHDILQLTTCGLCALYLLSFVSKRIEHTLIGRSIAYIGKNSYHIMALHLISINLFTALLNAIFHTSYPIYILGSKATSLMETIMLTAAGIGISLIITVSLTTLYDLCKRKLS